MSATTISPIRPFSTGAWGLSLIVAFLLALLAARCLAADLSQIISRTAPVSAFFCVQASGIPNFGVADGYTIPAQAGKTVAGPYYPERTPIPGWDHLSKLNKMSVQKAGATASKKQGSLAAKLADFQSAVIVASHHKGQRIGEVHTLVKLWAVELKLTGATATVAALEAERAQLMKKGGAL